jgi:hypothetical protein
MYILALYNAPLPVASIVRSSGKVSLASDHPARGKSRSLSRVSARTKISAFILAVLALHGLPVLLYQGAQQTRWPFLVWAMYAQSSPPGPIEAFMYEFVAMSPHGKARKLSNKDVGVSFAALGSRVTRPMSRGDTSAGRWLLDRVNRLGPDSAVQIRLETYRYRLVESGIAVDTLPAIMYPPSTPGTAR